MERLREFCNIRTIKLTDHSNVNCSVYVFELIKFELYCRFLVVILIELRVETI